MNVSCKQKQLGKIRFLHSPLPPNRYWKASGGRRCVHVALSASRCIAVNAPPSPVHASPVHALRLRCRVPRVALSGYLQRARPKRREMCNSGTAHCASKQNWATDAGFEIGFAVAQAGFGPDSCLISTTLGFLSTSRHCAKRNALERSHSPGVPCFGAPFAHLLEPRCAQSARLSSLGYHERPRKQPGACRDRSDSGLRCRSWRRDPDRSCRTLRRFRKGCRRFAPRTPARFRPAR